MSTASWLLLSLVRDAISVMCIASCDFACCMTGPKESEQPRAGAGVNVASRVDYDGDSDIDMRDYAEFQRRLEPKNN